MAEGITAEQTLRLEALRFASSNYGMAIQHEVVLEKATAYADFLVNGSKTGAPVTTRDTE